MRVPRTELVIRLGPINPVHPLGQWRGPAVIGLLLCGLVGGMWLLVRPIVRRILALAATASELGRGNLAARSGERGRDPIGDLAARFNQMAGALQAHVQSREELLRHVSHELRTPVQRLHFSLERFREDLAPEERETAIATMENELEELSRLIQELLSYARLRDQDVTTTEAVDVHATVAVTTQAHAELSDTVKATVAGPDAPRYANIEERVLRRAVSNLVGNAFRHARSRVHVSVTAATGVTHIDVDDDGAGVPEQDRERVFEPFTRLERSDVEGGDAGRRDHGFGLGLAIVRRIAERSRGTVSIQTAPLGGARFRMTLPEASRVGTADTPSAAGLTATGSSR